MSKLNVDQKTIKDLLQAKKSDFLIPDYQRPYAWGENECQTLWEDIFNFCVPDQGETEFDSNSEYFLGPIVTFKNEDNKIEVIDGQQRLTTIMLLLRAFYSKFGFMKDKKSESTKKNIEECLYKTDEFGEADVNQLKIDSEVATDSDKEQFLKILKTGKTDPTDKSRYAENYRYFEKEIAQFLEQYPSYFAYLPTRMMNNCILLPIEAESQDTALRIFSTLNDRGKPLSDADIFKAQLYKFYSNLGEREEFVTAWKELEELSTKIFKPMSGSPMDELFTRYMYYIRAKQGNKSSTTESLRKFYEKDGFKLLKNKQTFEDLQVLADFWEDVALQDTDRFSTRILERLFVLNYAPNGMWTYLLSVYFMHNRDKNHQLDEEKLFEFLNKMIAFVWTYAIIHPGVNSLRTPVYSEMVDIVNDRSTGFRDFKFDPEQVQSMLRSFKFSNFRGITKSMLTWWAFEQPDQVLLSNDTPFEIEHIYARNRNNEGYGLKNKRNLESIGNKSLLEKRINIRASDYRFEDKKKYYLGYTNSRKQVKEGTEIAELRHLAQDKTDFTEADIEQRTEEIFNSWMDNLTKNDLIAWHLIS